jgi:O-antigen/teichoic acid export membrane protein
VVSCLYSSGAYRFRQGSLLPGGYHVTTVPMCWGFARYFFSIWGLVEVAVNSSLKQYMVRNLAKLYQQQHIALYNASVLRVLRLGIVLASFLSLLLMVFSARVAESFFDSSYASVIFYTAPVLLVLSVSSILQENLRLREKLKAFNFLSLASHGLFAPTGAYCSALYFLVIA